MSENSGQFLRGGARAVTGVAVIGVSVGVAVVLGTGIAPVPSLDRGVVAIEVDTNQDARYSLVCTGSFAELGSDPSQPSAAIPGGETQLVVTGSDFDSTELSRELSGGTAPVALGTAAEEPLAAAEAQQVLTPTLQGLAASACAEPSHEQWLVGGGTGLGQSTTLVLGNPFEVPATVRVTLFDGEGRIDSAQTAGVLVPAGSQRIVSINGYAPGRDQLAARVESTGAAVTAALGVSQTVDIRSYAVDSVTRQVSPATRLVFPAVINIGEHERLADEPDDFPVIVRLLAPEGSEGTASVRALRENGVGENLGTVEFDGRGVVDLEVPIWNDATQAIVVESEVPVVGGVFASADIAPSHDYTWFAPAPSIPADTETAVSVVTDGELVIANAGDSDAEVTIRPVAENRDEVTVEVPAGSATTIEARGQNYLTSTAPVSASVRVVMGSYIASYPVFAPPELSASLTVYTR